MKKGDKTHKLNRNARPPSEHAQLDRIEETLSELKKEITSLKADLAAKPTTGPGGMMTAGDDGDTHDPDPG